MGFVSFTGVGAIGRDQKTREEERGGERGWRERKAAMRPDGSKARDQEQWSTGTG